MKNLTGILDGKLAEARDALLATSLDIEKATLYCSDNYLNSKSSGKLENSMAFATQSLGAVAYQINCFAAHFLDALDHQSEHMAELLDNLSKFSMVVKIHQEKVARKAIGSCTVAKVPIDYRHENVQPEPPQKYLRHPINYSILDNIGHGIPTQEPNQYGHPFSQVSTLTRRNNSTYGPSLQTGSVRQHSTISCRSMSSKSSLEYAAPVSNARPQINTVGRTAGIYRNSIMPPHFLNAQSVAPALQQVSSGCSPVGSMSSSNYAPSAAVGTSNQMIVDGGGYISTSGQSRRSSESSNAGSNVQFHHGHYASNQQQIQTNYGQNVQLPHPVQTKTLTQQQYLPSHLVYTSGGTPPITGVIDPNGHPTEVPPLMASQLQYAQQQQPQWVSSVQQVQKMHQQQILRDSALQRQQTSEMIQKTAKMTLTNSAEQASVVTTSAPRQNAIERNSEDLIPVTDELTIPPPNAYASDSSFNYQQDQHLDHHSMNREQEISRNDSTQLVKRTPRQPGDPAWAPDFYMEKVITLYEYVRDKDDELTFTENQIIYVIKKNDDGWWEGIMNGITGLFPGNYVEPFELG